MLSGMTQNETLTMKRHDMFKVASVVNRMARVLMPGAFIALAQGAFAQHFIKRGEETFAVRLAAEHGIDPRVLHGVGVISSGTLDSLPHDGAMVTLLAVCGSTHRESHLDIVMVAIIGPIIALAAVIV